MPSPRSRPTGRWRAPQRSCAARGRWPSRRRYVGLTNPVAHVAHGPANQTSDSSPNAIDRPNAVTSTTKSLVGPEPWLAAFEGRLDWLNGLGKDVPDQEQDDAGSRRTSGVPASSSRGSANGRWAGRGRSWRRRSRTAAPSVRRTRVSPVGIGPRESTRCMSYVVKDPCRRDARVLAPGTRRPSAVRRRPGLARMTCEHRAAGGR